MEESTVLGQLLVSFKWRMEINLITISITEGMINRLTSVVHQFNLVGILNNRMLNS
jgi:hypothetical protein